VPLPPFQPGQFLTLALDIPASEGRPPGSPPVTRCYSLSDGPDPARYRITVKRVPTGIASSYLHASVQVGDIMQLRAPAGPFVLDRSSDRPIVLVGGGIGITPLISMALWSLEQHPARGVHLYYGVRNGAEQAFKETLEKLAAGHSALHVMTVYSSPGPNDLPGRDYQCAGHIDIDLLRRTLPHGSYQFYVCGPAAMMASLVPALHAWGVPAGDVHHEAFGPASLVPGLEAASAADGSTAYELMFRRSGRTLTWDGRDATLLDFAERHGIAVPSGCRAGSCGSCETTLVSGTVTYRSTPDYEVAPDACLLCVGRPASPLCLEA
jgi:ferredoxin-NADP reductase